MVELLQPKKLSTYSNGTIFFRDDSERVKHSNLQAVQLILKTISFISGNSLATLQITSASIGHRRVPREVKGLFEISHYFPRNLPGIVPRLS